MRYLLGDSTESDLDFNYLTFLREVVDAAVVLFETEATLGVNLERRNTRANEAAGQIRAVEELGKEAAALVEPIVKEQPKTPAGRCAATIGSAIKEAVDAEVTQAKTALAAAREDVDREDQLVRAKARAVLEKLLRAHDLPNAEKEIEAQWTAGQVRAKLRERTKFNVEAMISLETQGSAVLATDLRVDRIAENVEVHVHEAGGWLKKSDKLVAQKLGRYQVVGVRAAASQVVVQLRSTPDANALTLQITVPRTGDIAIEGSAPGKEYTLEERDRAGLKLVAEKLEAALHELEDQRTGLADLSIDTKPFADHPHPRVLAERLIAAIAPTVQMISRHSRSPGELVLRRQISGDRREEVFIPISELVKRIETLPPPARLAFAPLELGGEGPAPRSRTPTAEPTVRVQPIVPPAAAPVVPSVVAPVVPSVSAPVVPSVAAAPPVRGSSPTTPPRESPRTIPPTPLKSSEPDAEAKLAASIDAALDEAEGFFPPSK